MTDTILILTLLALVFGALLLIAPIAIWHNIAMLRRETKAHHQAQAELLQELLREARLHTNRDVPCPACKTAIRLTDGRGKCAHCGQSVAA